MKCCVPSVPVTASAIKASEADSGSVRWRFGAQSLACAAQKHRMITAQQLHPGARLVHGGGVAEEEERRK